MEDFVSISDFSVVRSISTAVIDPILTFGVVVGEIIERKKADNSLIGKPLV
jgi:hypothetical protein